jgi:hypothetical protein
MTKTEPPRDAKPDSQPQYRWKLIWRNIILYLIMHITGLYGLYLLVLYSQWKTIFWGERYHLVPSSLYFFSFSLVPSGSSPPGSDRRDSPTLGPQGLQGQTTPQDALVHLPDSLPSESHLRLGHLPQGPPQVRRHRRGPPQLPPRLLFLSRGVVVH